MKNLLISLGMIALLLLLSGPGLFAQSLRSAAGNPRASVDSSGTIRNDSGSVGRIDSSGAVRDNSGQQIGRVDSDGTVRASSGQQIGRVDSDGTVRGSSSQQIGRVDSDGTVRGSSGQQIGSARGVNRYWAAIAFFFFPL
ncbi:hypothetical protein EHO59_16740 [Leptospira semungkisensis]|uniref:Uncharacterized protein n=1 Tax=Leptospira semungkisensis TaxID=2484985 RepID=A0A4R9FN65_9LEPT|nr:hypothetical protein [Leptospira semungkisensis]TGJ99499.1 hypothetical protein EHO59_16740 [Leptospira semungkisensis]